MDRRRFLGSSLTASAGVLAGPRLASARATGANDRIRVGVIGTGGRARGLMRQLKELPGAQMVAVSDVYEPRVLEPRRSRAARPPATSTTGGSSRTRRSTRSSSALPTTGTRR